VPGVAARALPHRQERRGPCAVGAARDDPPMVEYGNGISQGAVPAAASAAYVNWCGHAQEFIPLLDAEGWCRLVPVIGEAT
jgi:hypothetical protein